MQLSCCAARIAASLRLRGAKMQWFKHSKDFRNSPEIQFIESQLGEAGYARACKFLEIIATIAGKKKPFKPIITLDPPYTWRWLALSLGCVDTKDGLPDIEGAVKTIELFEMAGFASIVQTAEWDMPTHFQNIPSHPSQIKQVTRPYVISVYKMTDWAEWHDLSNRNAGKRKKSAEGQTEGDAIPASGKVHFAGMKTPE
jgi:hypothetical protein